MTCWLNPGKSCRSVYGTAVIANRPMRGISMHHIRHQMAEEHTCCRY
ncbi:Uncharacterized protein APZ42_033868 [Daphnia magna]|uniref:Uncharacterized protein n=1 Tax=Daphnia magna TaxID=35525 RepID=A0A164KN77_9CRUS|nr:Uncharacterized protein APZ42_033868 [Daphnia magna]